MQSLFNPVQHCNPQLTSYSTWSRDEAGRTPLHTAAQYGEFEVVKHLLFTDEVPIFTLNLEPGHKLSNALKLISQRKLSERHRDFSGNTPLHTACVHGQLDVVKLLTHEIGCDPNNTNSEGLSCLHLAAQHGHLPLVRYLVEEVGSDVTLEDEHGRSPTYLAADGGHLDILKYLIDERGANAYFRTTREWETSQHIISTGQSLLHIASREEHYNVSSDLPQFSRDLSRVSSDLPQVSRDLPQVSIGTSLRSFLKSVGTSLRS